MPFESGELKYLYELLIELGHPITASEAARLFAAGELAAYVQSIIDAQLPPACAPGDTKCVGYDLYRCEEVLGSPQWVRKEQNSAECGYVPPPPDPEIKKRGIRLYQARLDAWAVLLQAPQEVEDAEDYLNQVGDDWLYASYQYDKYRGFLHEWEEAEDNYWANKREIEDLQDELDNFNRELDDLYSRISEIYTELLNMQETIDYFEYLVEMYEDDVAYAQSLVDQKARELEDCIIAHGGHIAECMDLQQAWLVARDLFEEAEYYLEDAQATLSFFEIQKQSLFIEVNDAWNDVNDVQYWIAYIEEEIEDLLGVLADIDTIEEQIERFEAFVDYWHSEMWYWEDEMEVAELRLRMALIHLSAAEDGWDYANGRWSRFMYEHPVIAQQIIDEW